MAKSKKKSAVQTIVKKEPFSFNWKGIKYNLGDTFLLSLPQMGFQEEVALWSGYEYGFGPSLMFGFGTIDWCMISIDLDSETGLRKDNPQIRLLWRLSDWIREGDAVCMGKSRDNPYRILGLPQRIDVPMQLDGYVLTPVEGWELPIKVNSLPELPPLTQPVQQVATNLITAPKQLRIFNEY